jgi:hypothetical protein
LEFYKNKCPVQKKFKSSLEPPFASGWRLKVQAPLLADDTLIVLEGLSGNGGGRPNPQQLTGSHNFYCLWALMAKEILLFG